MTNLYTFQGVWSGAHVQPMNLLSEFTSRCFKRHLFENQTESRTISPKKHLSSTFTFLTVCPFHPVGLWICAARTSRAAGWRKSNVYDCTLDWLLLVFGTIPFWELFNFGLVLVYFLKFYRKWFSPALCSHLWKRVVPPARETWTRVNTRLVTLKTMNGWLICDKCICSILLFMLLGLMNVASQTIKLSTRFILRTVILLTFTVSKQQS